MLSRMVCAFALSTSLLCGVPALAATSAGSTAAASKPVTSPIKYELKFERPNSHLMDVTMHIDGLSGATASVAIPDWAPGSYYIQNYSANVQSFSATAGGAPGGAALKWRKTDSQTWQIDLAARTAVTVSYKIFGNTLQNNIAQYNEKHAFIGGPSVWMYLVGGKERPTELTIDAPGGMESGDGDGAHGCGREHVSRGELQLVRGCAAGDWRVRGEGF